MSENNKKTYLVTRPEVHYASILIDASSPEEAIKLVSKGNDENEIEFEYSHTLDVSEWKAEEYKQRG